MDIRLVRFWVIIALEIEDPKGIEMGVNGHVKGVRLFAYAIIAAVVIKILSEARVTC